MVGVLFIFVGDLFIEVVMFQSIGLSHFVVVCGLLGVCIVCRAAPVFIVVEVNGFDVSCLTMCGDCFLCCLCE